MEVVNSRNSVYISFHTLIFFQIKDCNTNSFGPNESILKKCFSKKCHKELRVENGKGGIAVDINRPLYRGMRDPFLLKERDGNPSMAHPVCREFMKSREFQDMKNAFEHQESKDMDSQGKRLSMDKQGFVMNSNYHFVGWVKIIDGDNNNEEIICYPHTHEVYKKLKSQTMNYHPFKYGWCETCPTEQLPNGQVMTGNDCMATPSTGWGWCQVGGAVGVTIKHIILLQ